MVLFDIGALLFLTGLFLVIYTFFKKAPGAAILFVIMSLIGGVLMLIAYYGVMGNKSIFDF